MNYFVQRYALQYHVTNSSNRNLFDFLNPSEIKLTTSYIDLQFKLDTVSNLSIPLL